MADDDVKAVGLVARCFRFDFDFLKPTAVAGERDFLFVGGTFCYFEVYLGFGERDLDFSVCYNLEQLSDYYRFVKSILFLSVALEILILTLSLN